ncbi:hypothetical protein D3C81_2059780 [compost metagenome]
MGNEQQFAQGLELTRAVAGDTAAVRLALITGRQHQAYQATVAGFNQGRTGA